MWGLTWTTFGLPFWQFPSGPTPPPTPSFLLLETGDYILLETGDKFVLEA